MEPGTAVTIDLRRVPVVDAEQVKELARLHAEDLWEEGFQRSLDDPAFADFALRIEVAWQAISTRADYTLVTAVMALVHCQSMGLLSIHPVKGGELTPEALADAVLNVAAVLAHSLTTNIVSFLETPEVIPTNDHIRSSEAARLVFRVLPDES